MFPTCPLKTSPWLMQNRVATDAFRKSQNVARKRYPPEEIINKLRAIAVHLAAGMAHAQAVNRE